MLLSDNKAFDFIVNHNDIERLADKLCVDGKISKGTANWMVILNRQGCYSYATGFGMSDKLVDVILGATN